MELQTCELQIDPSTFLTLIPVKFDKDLFIFIISKEGKANKVTALNRPYFELMELIKNSKTCKDLIPALNKAKFILYDPSKTTHADFVIFELNNTYDDGEIANIQQIHFKNLYQDLNDFINHQKINISKEELEKILSK